MYGHSLNHLTNKEKDMITKKDFNNIAEVVRKHLTTSEQKDLFVRQLADYFEKENTNFNRGMFVHACYWRKA